MKVNAPTIRIDDPARLAAVHAVGLLDTPAEEAFDRLSRLAARCVRAPVVLVALIDADRQYLKSCIGLPEPWCVRRETPLSESFCLDGRVADEPLLVEDARTHPLFANSPAIRDLRAVAYLGVPLVTPEGYVLGTFCVIDSHPRQWGEDDVTVVRDLAAAVMTEIQLRAVSAARSQLEGERDDYAALSVRLQTEVTARKRAERSLRESMRFNRRVAEVLPSVLYVLDLRTRKNVYVNREVGGVLGYTPEQIQAMKQDFVPRMMHPEDHARFARHMLALAGLPDGVTADFEYRMRAADGAWHWMLSRDTVFERDAGGAPVQILGTATDITERKRAEQAMHASNEKLGLFIEYAPAALAMFDTELRYLAVSRRWRIDYGLGNRDIIGKTHYEVFPEIPDRWKDVHRRALAGEVVRCDEDRFVRLYGTVQWLRWEVRPWYAADGSVGGILMLTEDMTEHKRGEQALRRSEERFRLAQRLAGTGTWEWDLRTREVFLSTEILGMFGLSAEQFEGTIEDVARRIHRDDVEGWRESIRACAEAGREYRLEMRVVRPDGGMRWVAAFGDAERDANGTAVRMLGVALDVTGRKRTEEALRESEEQLHTTLDSIADAVIATDTDGAIVRMNPMAERLTGWNADAAIGRQLSDIFNIVNAETRRVVHNPVSRVLACGCVVGLANHTVLVSRQHQEYQIADSAAPIRDAHGRITGVVLVFRDVTEEYAMRDEIAASEVRYRTISELVSDFGGCHRLTAEGKLEVEWFFGPFQGLTGYSMEELPGPTGLFSIMHPDDRPQAWRNQQRLLDEGRAYSHEFRIVTKSGAIRWLRGYGTRKRDSRGELLFYHVAQDITGRRVAEEEVKASLREKETMLQEIYHRTKNNMQVISAFLELQAASTGNRDVNRIIHDSTTRIRTMALAHEKLYKGKSLSRVNMREYITDLGQLLASSSNVAAERVSLRYDIDDIESLIDIAIPCGLIVNELLANAFKHAFPHGRKGRIDIGLHRAGTQLELTVGDNGVGVPADFDITQAKSLGVRLVLQVTKHQLGGEATVERDHGLRWRIRFREDLYRARV